MYEELTDAFRENPRWLESRVQAIEERQSFSITLKRNPSLPLSLFRDCLLRGVMWHEALKSSSLSLDEAKWHMSPWSKCSRPCGGGTQSRSAACYLPSVNRLVGEWLCQNLPRPVVKRACNNFSCDFYMLDFHSVAVNMQECGDTCSPLYAERSFHCVSSLTGYISALDHCPDLTSNFAFLEKSFR